MDDEKRSGVVKLYNCVHRDGTVPKDVAYQHYFSGGQQLSHLADVIGTIAAMMGFVATPGARAVLVLGEETEIDKAIEESSQLVAFAVELLLQAFLIARPSDLPHEPKRPDDPTSCWHFVDSVTVN